MNENIEIWIKQQFNGVNLGDKRLNNRTRIIARNMIKKPSASINRQSENWGQSKGAYRFFDSKKVSFQELIRPHTKLITNEANSVDVILAIQDTCYIGYDHHPSVEGLGHIGAKDTHGLILHNVLAVDPSLQNPRVIGVLDQWIHNRINIKDDEWKETKLWLDASKRIGIDVTKTKVVEVMDREGSVYSIIKNCLTLNHDFVIRAKSNRVVRTPFKHMLFDVCSKIEPAGHMEIDVQKKKGQIRRKAKLGVKYLPIEIPGPVGKRDESINCNLVQVVEIDPPKGQEPLSWFLLTSVEVKNYEDAIKIIEWYKYRWIIEEYHKCIKTGCKVESKQLKSAFRIENFLGIAAVIAVKLLQIRDLARIMPNKLAIEVIDPLSIKILQQYQGNTKNNLTIREYFISLAKLGGFLNRKSDGNPGWQTLWEGQQQLYWMVEGAKTIMSMKTYG